MRKIAWLLVLPYYVVISSGVDNQNKPMEVADLHASAAPSKWSIMRYECPPDYKCAEYIKDLAASLNEVHCKQNPMPKDCSMYTPS